MGRKASKADVMELIKSVPLFSGCSKRELSLLAGIADEMEFGPAQAIVTEGETGVGLQVVMEGKVKVVVGGRTRRVLGPGAFFGEIALLDGGPRSATVVADSDVRTLAIPAWSFNAVLKAEPGLSHKMLLELARRIRESDVSP